jgi:small redox-active disulfide protein 2
MKAEVLGTGCKNCDQLYENLKTAVSSIDSETAIEIEKIGDIQYFTKMGVFMTPGLVIDGEVVAVGKVLSADEIKQKIEEKMG